MVPRPLLLLVYKRLHHLGAIKALPLIKSSFRFNEFLPRPCHSRRRRRNAALKEKIYSRFLHFAGRELSKRFIGFKFVLCEYGTSYFEEEKRNFQLDGRTVWVRVVPPGEEAEEGDASFEGRKTPFTWTQSSSSTTPPPLPPLGRLVCPSAVDGILKNTRPITAEVRYIGQVLTGRVSETRSGNQRNVTQSSRTDNKRKKCTECIRSVVGGRFLV